MASRRSILAVTFTLAVGITISLALFQFVRQQAIDDARAETARMAQGGAGGLSRVSDQYQEIVVSLRSFFTASQEVDQGEFKQFVHSTLESHQPGLQRFIWAPQVAAAELDEFARSASLDSGKPFVVFERDDDGRPRPPSGRENYYPLRYSEPEQPGEPLGFDLSSSLTYAEAMRLADKNNRPSATRAFRFDGSEGETGAGCLLLLPVEAAERGGRPLGYVGVYLLASGMQKTPLMTLDGEGLNYSLEDMSAPHDLRVLYRTRGWNDEPTAWEKDTRQEPIAVPMGGRQWTLHVRGVPRRLMQQLAWSGWGTLIVGLVITGLAAAYLATILSHARRAETLVTRRTGELAAANNQLTLHLEERDRAEQAAREQAAQTRLIIDTAHDGFVSMNAEGRILDWNPAAERCFGWPKSDAVGQFVEALIVPERYRATHRAGLERYLRTGEGPALNRRIELVGLRRDGEEFPLEITIAPMRQGDSFVFNAFLHDISARKRAEAELQQAKDAAEEAARAKSLFLANMSHEIRTPLGGVIGLTELVLGTRLESRQREYLNMVRESGNSLLTVINDVLDFSKIEAGRLEIEEIPFDLRERLADPLNALVFRARSKELDLSWRVSPDAPTVVVGDPIRLRQVLTNLVGNAIKFTQRGEVRVDVEVAERDDEFVTLEFAVADTGIGISPRQKARIFEAFEQGDASTTRRFGGTGLGLAISARLVQLMGGRIWVESEAGAGSTFRFTAKLRAASEQELASHVQGDAGESTSGRAAAPDDAGIPPLSILLVEDSHVNQLLASALLQRHGHRVSTVENGAKAVEALARDHAFDLVLMDVQMPEMDGLEATARIRRWEAGQGRHVPIIAMTARALKGDRERCLEAGMDGYVPKPLRFRELLKEIAGLAKLLPTHRAPWNESGLPEEGPSSGESPTEALTAGLDWGVALETVQGDRELLHDLTRAFVDEAPRLIERLEQSLANQRAEGVHHAAHTLKGSLRYFGAHQAFESAFELERMGREGDLTNASASMARLASLLERILPEMRRKLAERIET